VFIQFGHNDESINKPDRYTPPPQYRQNLKRFVAEVLAENAIPVLVTPVAHRKFKNGQVVANTHGVYPAIVKEVAAENGVSLIDLQAESVALIARYGEEESRKLFVHVAPGESDLFPEGKIDNTHFSQFGAMQIANLIAGAIRDLKLSPLNGFLRNTGLQTNFIR
jgi:lysophospholipase L1-like esterase